MNCKQGDLAIIVKSYAGNEGKVVRCVEYLGEVGWLSVFTGQIEYVPTWGIDVPLPGVEGADWPIPAIADYQLRPLRPDEGDDETLSWVGKPKKVAA